MQRKFKRGQSAKEPSAALASGRGICFILEGQIIQIEW